MEKNVERRGGARKGAGRKSKSAELKLVESLTPYNNAVLDILIEKALEGDKDMIKLFMGYLHGLPTAKSIVNTNMTMSSLELKDLITFNKKSLE